MKTKNVLQFIFCLAVFVSASALAQNSEPTPAVHVGTSNRNKIGTIDHPVTAEEMTAFLVTWNLENKNEKWYDDSFMTTSFAWPASRNKQACIEYQYSEPWNGIPLDKEYIVLPGHEHDIIDAVESPSFQAAFNAWRENPTALELCEYMNDQIAGKAHAANAIKNQYSPAFSFFDQLDQYAKNYHVYSKDSNWFLGWGDNNGVMQIEGRVDGTVIGSFLFFEDQGSVPDNKTILPNLEIFYCDNCAIDELGKIIIHRGFDATHPAVVTEGFEYLRPRSIVVCSVPVEANSPAILEPYSAVKNPSHFEAATPTKKSKK